MHHTGWSRIVCQLGFSNMEPILGQMSSHLTHVNVGTYHYIYPNFIAITWTIHGICSSKHGVKFSCFTWAAKALFTNPSGYSDLGAPKWCTQKQIGLAAVLKLNPESVWIWLCSSIWDLHISPNLWVALSLPCRKALLEILYHQKTLEWMNECLFVLAE